MTAPPPTHTNFRRRAAVRCAGGAGGRDAGGFGGGTLPGYAGMFIQLSSVGDGAIHVPARFSRESTESRDWRLQDGQSTFNSKLWEETVEVGQRLRAIGVMTASSFSSWPAVTTTDDDHGWYAFPSRVTSRRCSPGATSVTLRGVSPTALPSSDTRAPSGRDVTSSDPVVVNGADSLVASEGASRFTVCGVGLVRIAPVAAGGWTRSGTRVCSVGKKGCQ